MRRWLVAAGCSIGLAVGFGPVFVYSFGLFQKPMVAELGWNRAEFSLGFSLATLLTAVLNTWVGALIDRRGVRPVALAGAVVVPAVLFAYSFVHSYTAFLLLAIGMGLCGATTSYPTYIPTLPPWFKTRLGLAFSVAAAGVGYGAALVPMLTAAFLARFGWREAFQALAGVVLAIGLLNALVLVRDAPRAPHTPEEAVAARGESFRLFKTAMRSDLFWRLAIGFALVPLIGIGINFHFAAMLSDRGATSGEVASVLGVQGLAILVGRLGTGVVLDYLPTRLVALVLFGGQALGVALLISAAPGWGPLAAAALFGLATGGEGDLMPYVITRRYGVAAYGKIYSACFAVYNVGTLLGPIVMGFGYERFGSYTLVLGGFCILALVATGLIVASSGTTEAAGPKEAATPA